MINIILYRLYRKAISTESKSSVFIKLSQKYTCIYFRLPVDYKSINISHRNVHASYI